MVSLWKRQSYGRQVSDTVALLKKECASVVAYLVTDSVPLVQPSVESSIAGAESEMAHTLFRGIGTGFCGTGPPPLLGTQMTW